MSWYITWLVLGAVLAISLGLLIVNVVRRTVPGALSLVMINALLILWAVVFILMLDARDVEEARLRGSFLFLSGALAAGYYLFSFRFLNPGRKLPGLVVLLFVAEPLLTLALALTDHNHALMRIHPVLLQWGSGSLLEYQSGPWVWADSIYSLIIYILALEMVARLLVSTPKIFRKQIGIILMGMGLPLISAGFIFSGYLPIFNGDIFIGLFAITNVILTWVVHTDRLGNVIPFARDSLFRSLTQGLIVVDRRGQIIEVNAAAQQLTGVGEQNLVGNRLDQTLPELASILPPGGAGGEAERQPVLLEERDLLVFVSPLLARKGDLRGWLIQLNDFREQNRLQRALEASESKYRSLTDNALDGIVIIQDDTVVYCNQQAAGMVGYQIDEMVGRDFGAFLHAENAVELRSRFMHHPEVSPGGRLLETTVIRKDGLSVPIEVNVNRTMYEGKPAMVGFMRDISRRKRTELELRRVETRLRNFMSQSTDGFFLLDEKGTVIEWNHAMEAITGLSTSRALGRFYPDVVFVLLPPEQRQSEQHDRMREQLMIALQTGEVQVLRTWGTEIARADGTRRHTQQQIFPIRSEHGYQIGATWRDVTEQNAAAEYLARRDIYLQAIFDNSPNMMWLKDQQGVYLAVNHVHAKAAGRKIEEVLGKTDFDLWDEETARRFIRNDREAIDGGERIVFEELQPTTQGEVWIETIKSPVYDQNGALIGTVGQARNINARKRAEIELRESEERFRMMADQAPVFIWMSTPAGQFSYLNRTWLAFVGKRLEDETGDGWKSNVYAEDLPMLMNLFALASEAKRGFTLEFRVRRADGATRWIYGTAAPRLDPDGDLLGYIGSCMDITDQKERENELKTFSLAVEQTPASIVITDPAGTIEFVNAKFCQVSGYNFFEVLGKNPSILKSGETPAEDYKVLWETISRGGEWHGIFHNRKKNGELYWERASISGIMDANGEIIHYLGIKEDISAQREVEQALHEKSARLEAIFNNSQIGIGWVDRHGKYVQVNQRFADMLGYSVDELLKLTNVDITYPEDVESTAGLFQSLVDGTIQQFSLEKRYVRKDGRLIWGSLSAMPILEADGTVSSCLGFIIDIGERKAIAEKLRASEELYRSIIHASPDDITITDLHGVIRVVSPAGLRLFGYDQIDEMVGKNIGEMLIYDDQKHPYGEILEDLERGQVKRLHGRGIRRDRSSFFFEATMELMRREESGTEGVVYIIRDVSDRLIMEKELRQRVDEQEALRATTNDLSVELDLSRLLDSMIERLVALLGASEGEVALYDEVDGVLIEVVSRDRDADYTGVLMRMGEGAMGRAAQNMRTLIIDDYSTWEGRSLQFAPVRRSVIAVPLVVHDRLLGVISIGAPPDTRPFFEKDARLVELFAQQAAIAIQNAKLFEEVQHLATLDPLTGVHNRRYFFERAQKELHRSQRYRSMMAVILLDVDHFKSINDQFGHASGDETLRAVARLCREETRDCDLVGRYGGEEFVILLPETGLDGAVCSAKRLCKRIESERVVTERGEVRVTVSVGVAELTDTTTHIEQILDQADQAMYRAKEAGRNRVAA